MTTFRLDGVTFIRNAPGLRVCAAPNPGSYLITKTESTLRFYESLRLSLPKDILGIGLLGGGALVYFDKLFHPDRLVGLDFRKGPFAALEEYREDKPHISIYYGRHQDKAGTAMAAKQNFPKGIDLVVDDASHLYEETKASFNMLFPMVRPGGHYIIENWSWAHAPNAQSENAPRLDKPALTNFMFELILMASRIGAVESLHVDSHIVCVRRGAGFYDPSGLDLSSILRGREMPLI